MCIDLECTNRSQGVEGRCVWPANSAEDSDRLGVGVLAVNVPIVMRRTLTILDVLRPSETVTSLPITRDYPNAAHRHNIRPKSTWFPPQQQAEQPQPSQALATRSSRRTSAIQKSARLPFKEVENRSKLQSSKAMTPMTLSRAQLRPKDLVEKILMCTRQKQLESAALLQLKLEVCSRSPAKPTHHRSARSIRSRIKKSSRLSGDLRRREGSLSDLLPYIKASKLYVS
jgi:hypothetical protein